MSENEDIVFNIVGDATQAISSVDETMQSIEATQQAISTLTEGVDRLKKTFSEIGDDSMSYYTNDMAAQFEIAEKNLIRIAKLRQNIETANGDTDRSQMERRFRNEFRQAVEQYNDLRESTRSYKELYSSLGNEFIQGIRTMLPRLTSEFGRISSAMVKAVGTQTDDTLIENYINSAQYRRLIAPLSQRNSELYSDSNMATLLRAIMPTSVSGLARNRFVEWQQHNVHKATTIRDLLPAAFGKIPLNNKVMDRTSARDDFKHVLLPTEVEAIKRIITTFPYVQEEAKRANLLKVENGNAFINRQATRGNVNAFAGEIANLFEVGARGMPSHGISDVEDVRYLASIENKTNQSITNARSVADALASTYRWLDPGRYSDATSSAPLWSNIGKAKSPMRKTSMEFLELDMANIDNDRNVRMLDGQTKYRYTPVSISLLQKTLSQQAAAGAVPFTANGFNSNEIYVSMPVKEFASPKLTEERDRELQEQIAKTIAHPIVKDGISYEFTGFTPTHAVFTQSLIKKSIEEQNPYFFSNGETRTQFGQYEPFAKANNYRRLLRTDGDDIRDLYGTDLNGVRVAVVDMKALSGLDGQNFISNKLVPESFQGRQFGGKATYSVFDVKALFDLYSNLIDATTGELVLPGVGVGGADVRLSKNVGIIEDWGNIKTNKAYDGMTQAEIEAARQKEIERYGIFAKTTYLGANTDSRYFSAQIAETLSLPKNAIEYFNSIYLKELVALNDPNAVVDLLFSGKDSLSLAVQQDHGILNTREAQTRIDEYRRSLIEHQGKGDLLLPLEEASFRMIAAWLPDVFNAALEKQGIELTEKQKMAGLGHGVAAFGVAGERVGLGRYPATVEGNVNADNLGANAFFQNLAKQLGLDEKALYINPVDTILDLMQGADEDGDTALVYQLKHAGESEFGKIMSDVLIATAKHYEKQRKADGRSDEQIAASNAAHTETIAEAGRIYRIDDPEDSSYWFSRSKKPVPDMGTASAVSRDSAQYSVYDQIAAQARQDSSGHYNVGSTSGIKTEKKWRPTNAEWKILAGGSPFSQLMNWASKSNVEGPNGKTVFDYESFAERKVDQVNFPSINQQDKLTSVIGMFKMAQMGVDTTAGYDWDAIMDSLPMSYDKDSQTGQLIQRLRELRVAQIKGEFLAFDDSLARELARRAATAKTEITNQVNADSSIAPNDKLNEISNRFRLAGGEVVRNLADWGLTKANISKNPELAKLFVEMESTYGDSIYQYGTNFIADYSTEAVTLAQKESSEAAKRIELLTEEKRKNEKEKNAVLNGQYGTEEENKNIIRLRAEISEIEQQLQSLDKRYNESIANEKNPSAIIDPSYEEARSILVSYLDEKKNELNTVITQDPRMQALTAKGQAIDNELLNYQTSYRAAEAVQKDALEYYKAQAEYERIISGAENFSTELWKSRRTNEARINETSKAQLYYDKQHGIANAYDRQLKDLTKGSNLTSDQIDNINRLRTSISRGVDIDFADKSVANAKWVSEDLLNRQNATAIDFDRSEQELNGYIAKLKEAAEYQRILLDMADRAGKSGDTDSETEFKNAAQETSNYINAGKKTLNDLRANLYNKDIENEDRMLQQVERFTRDRQRRHMDSRFLNQLMVNENDYDWYANQSESITNRLNIWQSRKASLEQNGSTNTEAYKLATGEIERLTSALANCQKEMDALSGSSGKVNAALTAVGQTASRVISQFGRQMFQKATNEARQFVVQYDAAMTEIQMVTLKTEEEINTLGDGMIDTAIDLHSNYKTVSDAAIALYRQGLPEEEVEQRLEEVVKFATTANVKATDAIKLITVAVNSGMVESAQKAVDVVSALGDAAATEAEQITKGLQKTLPAAKELNVTYEQLVAMLTVITSKTQLSGSVAGTTMRNLFSRMTRMNTSDIVYDSTGQIMSGSEQERVLGTYGIDMYDNGERRNPFDVLVEIGEMWDELGDRDKSLIVQVLGGTEQFSNVYSLMQGFSEKDENGNSLVQQYVDMANNSDGITDEKHKHHIESLAGAYDYLKSSFDELVSSISKGQELISVVSIFGDAIQGVTMFNNALAGLPAIISLVTAALIGMSAAINVNPALKGILIAAAGVVAVGKLIQSTVSFISGLDAPEPAPKSIPEKFNDQRKVVERATQLNEKRINFTITAEEQVELDDLINEIDGFGYALDGTTPSLDNVRDSASGTANALDNLTDKINHQEYTESNDAVYGIPALIAEKAIEYDNSVKVPEEEVEYHNLTIGKYAAEIGAAAALLKKIDTTAGGDEQILSSETFFAANAHSNLWPLLRIMSESNRFGNEMLTVANPDQYHGIESISLKDYMNPNSDIMTTNVDMIELNQLLKSGIAYYTQGSSAKNLTDYVLPYVEDVFRDYPGLEDISGSVLKTVINELVRLSKTPGKDDDNAFINSLMVDSNNDGVPDRITRSSFETVAAGLIPTETSAGNVYDLLVRASANREQPSFADAYLRLGNEMSLAAMSQNPYTAGIEMMGRLIESFGGESNFENFALDEDGPAWAKAMIQMFEKDEKGNISFVDGIDPQTALSNLAMILYGANPDTEQYSKYRPYQNVRVNASSVVDSLEGLHGVERLNTFESGLNPVSAFAELMREDFYRIFDENTANRIIAGDLSEDGMSYVRAIINAYGTGRNALSQNQIIESVYRLLDGRDIYSYTEGLPEEMLKAMYSTVDGLEEYVNYMRMDEIERENAGYTPEYAEYLEANVARSLALSRIDPSDYSKDVEQVVSNLTGTYSDQMQEFASKMMDRDSIERGRYAYSQIRSGSATSSDYATISSTIGIDENVVRNLSATKEGQILLEDMLNDRVESYSKIISDALMAMLPENFKFSRVGALNTDEIVAELGDVLSEGAIAMIQASGAMFDGEKFVFNFGSDSGYKDPSSAYTDAYSDYSKSNRDSEIIGYLVGGINAISNGYETSIEDYLANAAPTDIDWENFYANNPEIMLRRRAYENGLISSDDFINYLDYARYPGAEKSMDYYNPAIEALFGESYSGGAVDWMAAQEAYASLQDTPEGLQLVEDIMELEGGADVIAEIVNLMNGTKTETEDAAAAMDKFNAEVDSKATAQLLKYDKAAKQIESTMNGIRAGGQDASKAYLDLYDRMSDLGNVRTALDKYSSGIRSDNKVNKILADFLGVDERMLKNATDEDAQMLIDTATTSYNDAASQIETEAEHVLNYELQNALQQIYANGNTIDLGKFVMNGTVDAQGLANAINNAGGTVSSVWVSMVNALAKTLTAMFSISGEGVNQGFEIKTDGITGGKYYSSGGGGSKKSAADKLVERIGHGKDLYEHQIQMVRYEQTRYENADELGNYGKMLEEEIKIQQAFLPVLESNIDKLRDQLDETKEGSDDWYKLRDAILEAEEQYADIINTIDEANDKLEENQQAILKLHTDLEDMVVGEIELRIDAEKDQLAGSVNMQETILNAIKDRYRDEWDLIKEDIEKKKEALQQEKDLIDERLDARKDAEDQASKYAELAELKQQLSLISMDSTRTKDAAQLRESIAELEKEIGWDIAEREADNEKNVIQDQIDAYDDYVSEGDEDLEKLLEDANNFSEEVNSVLKLSQEDLFDWLKENVKEYANSLDDAQKQMVQSWEATYKQMLGITDTYWDQVNLILSSKDSFLEYMKQSNEYIYASEDERKQLLYQWEEAYDKWIKAKKNDADYNHGDPGLGDTGGGEYTGGSSSGGSGGGGSSSSSIKGYSVKVQGNGQTNTYNFPVSTYGSAAQAKAAAENYASQLKAQRPDYVITGPTAYTTTPSTGSSSGSSGSSGSSSLENGNKDSGHWKYIVRVNGEIKQTGWGHSTREKAQTAAAEWIRANNVSGAKYATYYYKKGGLNTQTGFAWLDGTVEEPERILSAQQTKSFDNLVGIMDDIRNSGISDEALGDMLKWSTTINVPSQLAHVGSDAFQGNVANIGDIYVTVNEAEINDEIDMNDLANELGQKFVKEISKQGFNIARFQF